MDRLNDPAVLALPHPVRFDAVGPAAMADPLDQRAARHNRVGFEQTRICSMAVDFVTVDRDTPGLFPATVQAYLPPDHLARFPSGMATAE